MLYNCLWKEILSQQRIRHFKILQSINFAYDVGIITSYSNKMMLYTSFNFSIYVTDFDLDSHRLESTLLLFGDSTPVPLFLFSVRTARQSQTRSLSLAEFWTCRWAVQNWSVFVTSSFFNAWWQL